MGNRYYLKYLIAGLAILGFPSGIGAQISAEKTDRSSLNFPSRLTSPWEGAVLTHTLKSKSRVNLVKFSPDGKILATVEASQVDLWNTDRGKIQLSFSTHQAAKNGMEIAPVAIAFSPDSRWLATATWGQGLLTPQHGAIVWDTTTGKPILSLQKNRGCRQVAFDRTGKTIYAACDRGIVAWSFPEGKELFSFNSEHPTEAIALSANGKVMATADADLTTKATEREIKLWQLTEEKPILLNTLQGHLNHIARLEFTPDSRRLVSSSYDGEIKIWHWQQGKTDRRIDSLHSDRGLFSLSADSRLIAGNFYSSTMTDLVTGLPLRNVMVTPKSQAITAIAFSPKGQLLVRIEQSPQNNNSLIHIWRWSE